MFWTYVVVKIKTHILCSIPPPPTRKSRCLWDNLEKYDRVIQATDDSMVHVLVCWITEAPHTKYVTLIVFPR
jgi:hypothetical protein